MTIDNETRSKIRAFCHRNHHTIWYPVNDAVVVEYFGHPIFTVTEKHVIIDAKRQNWTTLCRLNELLHIFNVPASIESVYREWTVIHPSGNCALTGNHVINRRLETPAPKARRVFE